MQNCILCRGCVQTNYGDIEHGIDTKIMYFDTDTDIVYIKLLKALFDLINCFSQTDE